MVFLPPATVLVPFLRACAVTASASISLIPHFNISCQILSSNVGTLSITKRKEMCVRETQHVTLACLELHPGQHNRERFSLTMVGS